MKHRLRPRKIIRELLDELIRGRLASPIRRITRLRNLPSSRRNINHRPRALSRQRQKLLDDVEGCDDVRLEGAEDLAGRDVFCWSEDVAGSRVRDQDVDFADFAEDGGDAGVVCD